MDENDPVLRQATEWVLQMRDPRTSIERVAEWQSWLSADKRHREAFLRVEELMGTADHIHTSTWPSTAELGADEYDGTMSVSEWNTAQPSAVRRFAPLALAATVLLAVAILLSGLPHSVDIPGLLSYKRVSTPATGTLSVLLADGSTADVGGQSLLRTLMTPRSRTITLERGEAFFRVAKDPARPFTVRAGDASITAIGTAFNVRRTGERIVVSVAEGVVKIDAPDADSARATPAQSLVAGQQLSIEPRGAELTVAAIDVGAVAGWRNGQLRYLNEPLSSVIADVARYTGREIELAESSIGELRITGTVLEHNMEGWLRSLEETFPLHAVRLADGGVRLERRE